MGSGPTISAVVAVYQGERWVADALASILTQTDPADEVIVVDDGSTDGTGAILSRHSGRITVIRQANRGAAAAFNRAIATARGDYVALCGADDLWRAEKLAWQRATLRRRPLVDVSFGAARIFGLEEAAYGRPPGTGLLDRRTLVDAMFRENVICAPSAVIRRELFERLGGYRTGCRAEDYDFWLRALQQGATFHYDDRVLLDYRRHERNASGNLLDMRRSSLEIHRRHRDLVARRLRRDVLATDLFLLGRHAVDEGQDWAARRAFLASLRYRPHGRVAAWAAVLCLPAHARSPVASALVAARRRGRT